VHRAAPARPVPPNHCAKNSAARLVLVSIRTQYAWLCARHRTVLSTAVTTGASHLKFDATPRGRFRVEGLNRNTVLYPAGGGAFPVRYWIPFDAPLYGFHDASWQKVPFGSPDYVTRGSHGCVHMPLRAIRFLFHWAHIGTRVLIR
jgi:lipoprotein-anchoring transpeptidase ErfK/SrfK